MAATLRLEIIRPRGPIANTSKTKVVGRMRTLGHDVVRSAAVYPTQRTSYRRTGRLGQTWGSREPFMQGQDLVVEVDNKMEYAGLVMGLKKGKRGSVQLTKFRHLGWRSIEDIGQEEIDRARPSLLNALQGR